MIFAHNLSRVLGNSRRENLGVKDYGDCTCHVVECTKRRRLDPGFRCVQRGEETGDSESEQLINDCKLNICLCEVIIVIKFYIL